jgi:hypothetical protein
MSPLAASGTRDSGRSRMVIARCSGGACRHGDSRVLSAWGFILAKPERSCSLARGTIYATLGAVSHIMENTQ